LSKVDFSALRFIRVFATSGTSNFRQKMNGPRTKNTGRGNWRENGSMERDGSYSQHRIPRKVEHLIDATTGGAPGPPYFSFNG